MKTKKHHQFILVVKTAGSKRAAELAVLSAFARRKPDGCEFHLRRNSILKKAWLAGAMSGTETGLDLATRSIEQLKKTCGFTTKTP